MTDTEAFTVLDGVRDLLMISYNNKIAVLHIMQRRAHAIIFTYNITVLQFGAWRATQ